MIYGTWSEAVALGWHVLSLKYQSKPSIKKGKGWIWEVLGERKRCELLSGKWICWRSTGSFPGSDQLKFVGMNLKRNQLASFLCFYSREYSAAWVQAQKRQITWFNRCWGFSRLVWRRQGRRKKGRERALSKAVEGDRKGVGDWTGQEGRADGGRVEG